MRLIQIGAGGFGRSWAELAAGATGVDLVAVVDPDPAARAWAGEALGFAPEALAATPDEAFARFEAEAALIVTPPPTHHSLALAALAAGRHVLLEKPLATSLAEAREMIAAADRASRVLMVSQNYRMRPAARAARDFVRRGALGGLVAVRVEFRRDTRALFPPGNFRYAMRHPLVLDMTIHHADLLRAITGQDVETVYARGWRVPDSPYAHDPAVVATMALAGGATVVYDGDWATRGAETSWNGDWEFIGERGRLRWTGDAADALGGVVTLEPAGEPARTLEFSASDQVVSDRPASLAAFRRAVETGAEPETAARDNIRSLAIVLACVESIERGDVVAVGGAEPCSRPPSSS
ncbi:MAG TPA: Gfo/Idh/MocA family oxidoreductase [Thermomicrobiales bacterium]|nr:Gfo/Idh/MocA family oxidoreductase [Thermomicrobiales bacterium]